MLGSLLKEFVMVKDEVASWEEAIKVAAKPLHDSGYITQNYIDKMITNVQEHGPYIVIMPNVALPHSHAEDGAVKTGISIMKLHTEVLFPEDKKVSLVVVLSANDSEIHMQLLSELVDIFMDDEKMKQVFNVQTKEELLEVL